MRIFVSYRHVNRSKTYILVQHLKRLGHDVWYDQEIISGQLWWDEIIKNIRTCDVFIIALTSSYFDSPVCVYEYTYALDLKRHLIPVLLDPEVDIRTTPPSIREIHSDIRYYRLEVESNWQLEHALNNAPTIPLPNPLPPDPPKPDSPVIKLWDRTRSESFRNVAEQIAIMKELKYYLNIPRHQSDAVDLLEYIQRMSTGTLSPQAMRLVKQMRDSLDPDDITESSTEGIGLRKVSYTSAQAVLTRDMKLSTGDRYRLISQVGKTIHNVQFWIAERLDKQRLLLLFYTYMPVKHDTQREAFVNLVKRYWETPLLKTITIDHLFYHKNLPGNFDSVVVVFSIDKIHGQVSFHKCRNKLFDLFFLSGEDS